MVFSRLRDWCWLVDWSLERTPECLESSQLVPMFHVPTLPETNSSPMKNGPSREEISSSNPNIHFQERLLFVSGSVFFRSKENLSVRIFGELLLVQKWEFFCQKSFQILEGVHPRTDVSGQKKKHGEVSFRPLTWLVGPRTQMAVA